MTERGGPVVHFLAFPKSTFAYNLSLSQALKFKWPPTLGLREERIWKMPVEEVGKYAGYWRPEGDCDRHPGAWGHLCLEDRLVEEWSRLGGKEPEPLTGVQDLDSLALADDTIVREWRKQAVWTRALYTSTSRSVLWANRRRSLPGSTRAHTRKFGARP